MASTYDIVRDAILNKKIVKATYGGHYREMCPHVIGTNKQGRQQALFYQFGGTSKSGLAPSGSADNWRCVAIEKLEGVSAESGEWQTAPNHSRPQTCVHSIDVEVEI